jgi:hypothetical protein
LRWALEAGEPKRVVVALCGAALSQAVVGTPRSAREAESLLARAEKEGRPLELPVIDAMLLGHRAVVHFMLGRFSEVLAPAVEAERMFRSLPGLNPEGWYFQSLSLLAVRTGALAALGEYTQLCSEVSRALREIRDTDNRGALLQMASIESIVDDVAGHPERAVARLNEQRDMLPEGRVGMLHALHLIAMLVTACATERFELGLDYLRTRWPAYVRSPAYRVATFRSIAHTARAQLLLNQHVREGSGSAKGLIEPDLSVMGKIAVPGNRSHCLRYEARLAFLSGRPELALQKLRESSKGYEDASMLAEIARNRYAEGLLLGGSEGKGLVDGAIHFLTVRGLSRAEEQLVRYFPELSAQRTSSRS